MNFASASTPSTSMGPITALPDMAFSTSSLCFVGILRATGNCLTSQSWTTDSGATHHVSHDRNLFLSLIDTLDRSVALPTRICVKIKGIGHIHLNEYLILNNVLFIPDFRLNLLSISQLTKDLKCRVSFDHSTCLIHDPIKGLMIGHCEEITNLYVLEASSIIGTSTQDLTFQLMLFLILLYGTIGYPSVERITVVTDVLGLKQKNKETFQYVICPLAKQKHLLYVSRDNMRDNAFDLPHIVLWVRFPYQLQKDINIS